MPGRIAAGQRYRDIAAECRERATLARSPKTRAEFDVFAWRYDIAEAELKRAPRYLFRCPIAGSGVEGILIEEALSDAHLLERLPEKTRVGSNK